MRRIRQQAESGGNIDAAIISAQELGRIRQAMVIKDRDQQVVDQAKYTKETELMQSAARIKKQRMARLDQQRRASKSPEVSIE